MRYALFMESKKFQIKRQDILTHVTNDRKEFTNEIIKEAQQKFKEIFGFEFVEVQKGTKSKSKHSDLNKKIESTSSSYILRDALNEVSKFVEWPSSTASEMGLLISILGLIYVNNKSITQGNHI